MEVEEGRLAEEQEEKWIKAYIDRGPFVGYGNGGAGGGSGLGRHLRRTFGGDITLQQVPQKN